MKMNTIKQFLIVSLLSLNRHTIVESIECVGADDLYNCITYDGIALDADEQCVAGDQVCDGTRDCTFGDDEWNCNTYGDSDVECTPDNGYFECERSPANQYLPTSDDTNICIRNKYSCNANDFETWDCPRQEDLTPAYCPFNFTQPCLESDHPLADLFYYCEVNKVCIYTFWQCNGIDDCLDGQDEDNATCPLTTTAEPFTTTEITTTEITTQAPTTQETTTVTTQAPTSQETTTQAPTSGITTTTIEIATTEGDSGDGTSTTSEAPTPRPSSYSTTEAGAPTRPSCWWTNYRGNSNCQPSEATPTSRPTPRPTPRPTDTPVSYTTTKAGSPTRPSDWWTNYRGN